MSLQRTVDVACPSCGQAGTFEYWDAVNVGLDPGMKEKVLSEEIFNWTCPHCGQKVYNPYGFCYHDMEHKFMLFFEPEAPKDGDKYAPMEIDSPFHIMDEYTFRPVYGMFRLIEKVAILEAGLNDIAVEHLKYFLRNHNDPEGLAEARAFTFLRRIAPCEANNMTDELAFWFYSSRTKDGVAFSVARTFYDQFLEVVETDPRFKDTGIHCIDEEWIGMKLKTEE